MHYKHSEKNGAISLLFKAERELSLPFKYVIELCRKLIHVPFQDSVEASKSTCTMWSRIKYQSLLSICMSENLIMVDKYKIRTVIHEEQSWINSEPLLYKNEHNLIIFSKRKIEGFGSEKESNYNIYFDGKKQKFLNIGLLLLTTIQWLQYEGYTESITHTF